MDLRGSTTRTRIAAMVAAVGLTALVMAPMAAFAATKAATKIVVSKSQVVANWSTPGVTPAAPSVTVKLYKKSGTKWVALKGAIAMQMENATTKAWGPKLTAKPASSVAFALPNRGRYRFVYAGTGTTKPVTAYSKRLDLIGESITLETVRRADLDETWTQVTASYVVTWNTEAFLPDADAKPLEFSFYGTFDNMSLDTPLYSGDVVFYQQMWEPGTAWISYRLRTEDIPPDLAPDVTKFYFDCRMLSDDPYVTIAPTSELEDYVTPQYLR